MRLLFLMPLLVSALLFGIPAFAADLSNPATHTQVQAPRPSETSAMKIRLTVDGHALTATLIDSPTTRDFVAMLPLTLELEDYAGTEKVADLPKKLTQEGAPAGVDPAVGDITFYAPWGNLALFYRDFGYAKGLIKLGSIDDGAEVFNVPGSVTVTIEAVQK